MEAGPGHDPAQARDLPEFIDALGRLRMSAGAVSYRTLAKRVGRLLNPPQNVAHTTIAGIFRPQRRRLDVDLMVATVRALGLNASDSARWREAYLRIQRDLASGGPAGVLRQLPAELATFTGRDEEVDKLIAAAAGRRGRAATVVVSAIEGMAGVGKTQLALRVANSLLRAGLFADVQLYVNLRGFDEDLPPSQPAQVLGTFLRQLGVAPAAIPQALDERAAMFRDRLRDRQALILLDNASDEEQIRTLIPGGAGVLVLVTSRRHLAGLEDADLLVLDVFTPADGMNLLTRIAGADRVGAEPEAAGRILELCGRLPLAVAMAAARLRSRPAWALSDLVRRIDGNRIAGLEHGQRSPWPVFELSYRSLTEPARDVFRLLSVHPGRDATAESTAALVGCELAQAQAILESLVDEHLLQQKSADRYEFHDLLRVYARNKADLDVPEARRTAAAERVLRWYAATANAAYTAIDPAYAATVPVMETSAPSMDFTDPTVAGDWLGEEQANLSDAVEQAHRQQLGFVSARISAAVTRFLLAEQRGKEALALRRIGLDGARQSQNRHDEAWALTHIAQAQIQLGDHAAAQNACAEALDIYRGLGDLVGQARGMSMYSFALLGTGRTEEALALSRESVAILRQTELHGETIAALSSLATCYHALHRSQEALDVLIEAEAVAEATKNPVRSAATVRNIGFTCLVLRRYEQAEEAFSKSAEGYQRIGNKFRYIECLHGMARAQFGRGEPDHARQTVARADAEIARQDATTAAHFRHSLETSPIRYDESTEIDPTAKGIG